MPISDWPIFYQLIECMLEFSFKTEEEKVKEYLEYKKMFDTLRNENKDEDLKFNLNLHFIHFQKKDGCYILW